MSNILPTYQKKKKKKKKKNYTCFDSKQVIGSNSLALLV